MRATQWFDITPAQSTQHATEGHLWVRRRKLLTAEMHRILTRFHSAIPRDGTVQVVLTLVENCLAAYSPREDPLMEVNCNDSVQPSSLKPPMPVSAGVNHLTSVFSRMYEVAGESDPSTSADEATSMRVAASKSAPATHSSFHLHVGHLPQSLEPEMPQTHRMKGGNDDGAPIAPAACPPMREPSAHFSAAAEKHKLSGYHDQAPGISHHNQIVAQVRKRSHAFRDTTHGEHSFDASAAPVVQQEHRFRPLEESGKVLRAVEVALKDLVSLLRDDALLLAATTCAFGLILTPVRLPHAACCYFFFVLFLVVATAHTVVFGSPKLKY